MGCHRLGPLGPPKAPRAGASPVAEGLAVRGLRHGGPQIARDSEATPALGGLILFFKRTFVKSEAPA
eukprot:15454951-Alexandrium_andersonii.AAC.1